MLMIEWVSVEERLPEPDTDKKYEVRRKSLPEGHKGREYKMFNGVGYWVQHCEVLKTFGGWLWDPEISHWRDQESDQ